MALSNPKLLQTLSLLALFLMLANNKVHSQEDHTSFLIDTFPSDPSSQNLIYEGDAHVPPGSSYLSLAGTDSSGNPQSGSCCRVLDSQFWESGSQASFETTFRFIATLKSNNIAADAIAFFIQPFRLPVRPPPVFTVEFHFYPNSESEPNYPYIGININSSTVSTTRFDNPFPQVVTARINYDKNTRRISVVATAGSQTYTLGYVFDLGTILSPPDLVGISACTGKGVAAFDLLSWYFNGEIEDMYMHKYHKKYV